MRCCDYEIRGCTASSYLSCSAYKEEKNCWEAEKEIPCCKRNDKTRCRECKIYLKYLEVEGIKRCKAGYEQM